MLGRSDAELLKDATSPDPSEPVLDRRNDPGAVDDDVPAATTIRLVRAGQHAVHAELPGGLQPRRIAVDHGDAGCSRAWCQLSHHQAHGAGAVDQIVLTHPSWQRSYPWMAHESGSIRAARARSTSSGSRWTLRTGATVSSAVDPSVRATPEPFHCSQRLDRPDRAVRTLAAREGRIDRDPVTGSELRDPLAHGLDHPGRLVTRNDRIPRGRELSIQDVEVGAAETDGLDPDEHVAGTWHGVGDLRQGPRPRFGEDDGPH